MMDANLRGICPTRGPRDARLPLADRLAVDLVGNLTGVDLPITPPRGQRITAGHGQGIEAKSCVICGRTITWRKKWARDWDSVRYCSDACRARRLTALDARLEQAILAKLADRPAAATICPSEVARDLGGADWRELMEPARQAARRLVVAGEVEITQKGCTVDPSTAKGPIRIRRTR